MSEHPYPKAVERFPTLRQSLLSAFDNCSLTAYFDQEYRQGWSTDYQARGEMFHRFAGECLREMARLGEDMIPVDAALSILRDLLRQEDVDAVCPNCGSKKIAAGIDLKTGNRKCLGCKQPFESEFINVSLSVVKDLHWVAIKWAHENAFDIANLVDVEQRLKATIRYPDPRGGYVERILTGQLDALMVEGEYAERAVVLDWKDTWALPPAHVEEEEDDTVSFGGYFQQRFYAWLVFQNYPSVHSVTLREFYVRYSEPRSATVTRDDEAEITSELAALVERFDRSWEEALAMTKARREKRPPFRPTAGKHCNFCIRPAACPIPQFARDEGRITDPERAADVARALMAGENVVKKARAALRSYADVHGPIPVADAKGKRALGYVEKTRVSRPKLEDIERAALMKGGPLEVHEIKELYRETTGTRFQAFVPEGVDEAASEEKIQRQLEESIEAARAAREAAGAEAA